MVCFIWIYYCGTETQDPLSFCLTEAPASGNNFHKNPGRSLWQPERFSLRKTKKTFCFFQVQPKSWCPGQNPQNFKTQDSVPQTAPRNLSPTSADLTYPEKFVSQRSSSLNSYLQCLSFLTAKTSADQFLLDLW